MDVNDRLSDPLVCRDASLTKQSFAAEVDINNILERVARGQDVASINNRLAQFGDVSNIPDYRESLDFINRANQMFMDLDWKIRERFQNDPALLIDFIENPKNIDEAVSLGILVRNGPQPKAAAAAAGVEGAATPSKPGDGTAPAQ